MDCLHEKWMMLALDEARLGAESGEVPVGAVIVSNGEVIAKAHNLCETNHCATAHAELLAIEEASQKLSSWRLSNCTLYVTLEPCPMCMGAIVNSRIGKVVFGAKDAKAGACGSVIDLRSYPLNHKPLVESGFMSEESLALLSDFFKGKREKR